MNSAEVKKHVVSLLTENDRFRPQLRLVVRPEDERPEIEFAFDAVLIGPQPCDGLVTVQIINAESADAVRCEVNALTTWLSGTDSRRSLVLIAIVDGDVASPDGLNTNAKQIRELLDELSTLCRVLEIDSNLPTLSVAELKRLVRPLLPLRVTPTGKNSAAQSPIERLKARIAADTKLKTNKLVDQVIRAAAKDSDDSVKKIEDAMVEWIKEQLDAAQGDEVST